jgi:hypothetical protein
MKHFLPIVVSGFLLVPAIGCHHAQPQSQMPPLQAQAPPAPDPALHPVPMEVIPLVPAKEHAEVTPPPVTTLPPQATKPERHHKPKQQPATTSGSAPAPAQAAATTAAQAPPPQTASSGTQPPPATTTTATLPHPSNAGSPIGQLAIGNLTEGDISGTTQAQAQEDTEKLIQSTEKGLSGLQRSLNAQEQETAKQIKKFLDQAREALAAQDAGGAKTLATKANLLLNELKK